MKFRNNLISMSLLSALPFASASALAADYKDNPFGLVYDGAITQNVKGQVNIQK